MMTPRGYTFSYYVSGHGFGHATRVNQVITELLKSTTTANDSAAPVNSSNSCSASRHTIYIVSDAPKFIFQDVIALGAIYRNAKVDAGVVQPLAYSVDRQQTIEGCKSFLSRREEMIQTEVSWLAQVGVDCVLADAPFLPCAAASAYGIPAVLITNFTFDEVYRFLQEGDELDKDVAACADAALEDYKKASLLLRLPGSIDIPAFGDEILTMMESSSLSLSNGHSPSISDMDDTEDDAHHMNQQQVINIADHLAQKKQKEQDQHRRDHEQDSDSEQEQCQDQQQCLETSMGETTPAGVMSPVSMRTALSSPSPSMSGSARFHSSSSASSSRLRSFRRRAVDVPLVVRMAVNTREDVLRSLNVDEETIATKKMVLVSFGGQRLKQGWGNPLPEGWVGVICGLPVEHELPEGFYRSPHGVYVPDLTRAADIVIGKLGYGTCSECIAHDKPLIFVPRPQFIEEHGLIRMMVNHGLAVEMTAEEFETGHWQRAILEADRQAQEEKEGRRLHMESCCSEKDTIAHHEEEAAVVVEEAFEPVSLGRRSRRSASVSSLSGFRPKRAKMARLSPVEDLVDSGEGVGQLVLADATAERKIEEVLVAPAPAVWFERRIPNNGGEVCARLVEEFMAQLDECDDA